jgi:APA family basic amino acid/polyamine antiporter
MREPRRMVPLAFLIVMGVVTFLYASVFLVASGTYGGLAGSENPIAEAARSFLGPFGGTIVAVGITVSIFGTLCASALVTPRCAFALAERGEAPAALAAVHSVYRTPSVAIVLSTAIVLTLALSGSFEELAVISVVARFSHYLPTCVAALVFRHRDRKAGRVEKGFRLPFGPTVPVLATLLCLALLAQTEPGRLLAGAAAFALGIPFYLVFARRQR